MKPVAVLFWGKGRGEVSLSNPQAQTTQRHFNWSKLRNSKRKSCGPKKTPLFPGETICGANLTKVLSAQTLPKVIRLS